MKYDIFMIKFAIEHFFLSYNHLQIEIVHL